MRIKEYIPRCLLLMGFTCLAIEAFADMAVQHWEFKKAIEHYKSTNKPVAVPIDPEVWDGALTSLNDLRILSKDGLKIPYVIMIEKETKQERKIQSKKISDNIGQTESTVTVELKNPKIAFNRVVVQPEHTNFCRKISIEGSNDQENWNSIRK